MLGPSVPVQWLNTAVFHSRSSIRSRGVFGAVSSAGGGWGGGDGAGLGVGVTFRGRRVWVGGAIDASVLLGWGGAAAPSDWCSSAPGSKPSLTALIGIACPMGVTTVCGGSVKVNDEVMGVRVTSSSTSPSRSGPPWSQYEPAPTANSTVAAASTVARRLRMARPLGRAGVIAAAVVSSAAADCVSVYVSAPR